MPRHALLPVLFAGALVFALDCGGATHAPLDLDDAGATGGSSGSNTGGATSTGGSYGAAGAFGGDPGTGGATGTGGLTGTGGSSGAAGAFGGDTGGSTGTADAGRERPDAGGGDGGRRRRDGGFGGGSRDGGGGGGMCPMGTRNGEACMPAGTMCSSMFNGTTRTCVCGNDRTWSCMRQ